MDQSIRQLMAVAPRCNCRLTAAPLLRRDGICQGTWGEYDTRLPPASLTVRWSDSVGLMSPRNTATVVPRMPCVASCLWLGL